MFFLRSKRAGRVTACTALALSAGMLLTGTATAGTPAPRPSVEKKAPSFTTPKLTLPKQGAARASVAAAEAVSLPLSDLDGDGYEDLILRAVDGALYAATSLETDAVFDLGRVGDVAKDVIPIGNQGGQSVKPEVLVLSENGTLTLYTDVGPAGTTKKSVVGGGWQTYNKITSPGDVNGDGKADVVARTHDGQLYLYLATDSATSPLGTRISVGGGWNVYDQLVGLGDGNGDGRGDLYARDLTGSLWWYPGTGDKTKPFGSPKSIGRGWGEYNQILPAGGGDLLARNNAGTLFYYAHNGDGTLAGRQQEGAVGDWAGITQFAGAGNNPYTGKDGVYATTPGGAMYWYGNTTTGKLGERQEVSGPGSWNGWNWMQLSSMNSDGGADLTFTVNGSLYIDAQEIGPGWDIYDSLVGPGDLSGDGKADLLARDRSGVLYLYRGNGKGDAFSTRIRIGGGWGAYNKLLGAGDYTGDGRTDLLARTPGGDLYLYPGTGKAATPFDTRVKIGGGWGSFKQLVAPGDLNADGKGDLISVNAAGELHRYLGTASTHAWNKFTQATKIGYGFQAYNTMS
ncbi:FG-GAP repeat domain-containing protein [Streptomyces sp. NPDC056747]|uniref:FG-GAP repeat domain-containing protein n=1 Tax=Streptomyces sp. NPDC056747 TaxID=3345935 RepID=UPI0036B8808F